MSESEASNVFKLKKSDIVETTAQVNIYTFTCPHCNKIISTYHKDKTIAYAKIHLTRIHGLKVIVED
jgi:transcription elongation factor Elf1